MILGILVLLPVVGIQVPYHPFLLKIYNPSVQTVLLRLGVLFFFGMLARDFAQVVQIRIHRWEMTRKEEEERKGKLKRIFRTPVKAKEDGKHVSWWNQTKR